MKQYELKDGFLFPAEEGRWVRASEAKTRVAELQEELDTWIHTNAIDVMQRRIAELEADRRVLQSTGEHPAPCARHCEANAFRIELRNKDARVAELERKLSESRSANGRWARGMDYVGALETRIAQLEAEAGVYRALLALADARLNREVLKTKGGA